MNHHVHVVRGNGQVLAVGLCNNCGKLFGFNPTSVPTHEDEPLCRECVVALINPARGEVGKDEVIIEPDAYEAYHEEIPENEAPLHMLKARLAVFKEAYENCSTIDHYPDVLHCRASFQPGIDRLTARIAELEGQEHAA